MYGNMQNGGLIAKHNNVEIISDFHKLWFMNTDDEYVYYSDGANNRYLSRFSENESNSIVILKKPCTNVMLSREWLYYINESDNKLYRCLKNGQSESVMIRDDISEFIVFGEEDLLYITKTGELKSTNGICIKGYPVHLCIAGGKLFYADSLNNFYLTYIDLETSKDGQQQCFGDSVPTYINHKEQYIYYTDALKGNSIYRLSIDSLSVVKIYGGSAGYLHIIEDKLYFWNGFVWKHISLEGGVANEVK